MGLILRTHMDTFNFLVRNLKIKNYKELIKVRREEIEKVVDLKKHGIFLKKGEWNSNQQPKKEIKKQ